MTTFGLPAQPQPPQPTPPAVLPPRIQIPVYSLRDAYKAAQLEAQINTTDSSYHSIDNMWKNCVIDDTQYSALAFPKPALIVAYQVIPTSGPPSMITPGSVVKLNVGMDLVDFATMRMQSSNATPGLAVYDVWVVYGPLRYTDIAS